jgi:hypothetical protein
MTSARFKFIIVNNSPFIGHTPAMFLSLVRQIKQLKYAGSTRWWIRKLHPWSTFSLIGWRWVRQHDRRTEHQVKLQQHFFKLNFQEIQLFLGDFIRPELWFM